MRRWPLFAAWRNVVQERLTLPPPPEPEAGGLAGGVEATGVLFEAGGVVEPVSPAPGVLAEVAAEAMDEAWLGAAWVAAATMEADWLGAALTAARVMAAA